MAVPLLATKLFVPPTRPELVSRPRLIERLDAGLRQDECFARRLSLVIAPAGFGKTTLVLEWLKGLDHPSAWLALDEGDNDPARFFTYLVAALQRIDPNIGQAVLEMLQAPQPPPPEVLLTSLINDITTTPQPFILVLDDYHLIRAPPIHQRLAFLLEHQPSQMHLVIATRTDPPLPLSRWRARGQAADIRQADLRFTEEETADFLRRVMRLDLSRADAAALRRRTEGWIAGLQLVALSLQGRDDVGQLVQSFAGSHRYILDYLIEEVFQRQPADVQDFLLKTSLLNRFTASLCDAITERDDSREVLLALERANLFIVPLDESRQWYRYHRLFADLLRQQLRTGGMRDQAPLLHRRASRWYEAAGLPIDAVQHALAGCDWARAAALIGSASETMLKRGEVTTLLGWYQALPEEVVHTRPGLCLGYSWALILTGQLEDAESYLGQAEQAAQTSGARPGQAALLGEIVSAQAYIARTRGDDRRTIALSQRALSLLPSDALTLRSVVAVNLGIARWSCGHMAEAEQALAEADHAAQQSGNQYARLTALSFLGAIQAARGRLHQAAELFQQAMRLGGQSPALAFAHNELSALLYEWNSLEEAAGLLQRGIELSQRGGNVEVQMGGYRMLARVEQAQGKASAALDTLQEAHRLACERDVSPHLRARNAACHAQVALAQADLATAVRWAEQAAEDADDFPFYPRLGLTQARLLLTQNERAAAAEELAARYETAARQGWQFGVVEVRVLQALAASTPTAAVGFLADALALAQPEGYVRTFVDKGEPMARLLQKAALQGIAPDYVAKLLAAFEAAPQERRRPEPPASPARRLLEPLSERELQVLRLVAAGLSNREIAEALYISVNTVKTHLQRLYGKLGVSSRTAAATNAQELNLL